MAEYCEARRKDFLELTNKFRTCVYIAEEDPGRVFTETGYDSVVPAYEVFTQYLTYEAGPQGGEPRLIEAVRVHDGVRPYWIHDIDVWVGLPPYVVEKMQAYSVHFFFYDTIDFVYRIK